MAKQSLMWTALPNGIDANGGLRVSALLSPRLTPDADQILKPFADMVDWPATVRNARFTVHYGGQSVDALPDGALALPDSPSWTSLFSKNTYVAGYVFENHTADTVLSYDTVAVHSLAQTLYSTLGASTSDSLPKVTQILGDPNWQQLIQSVAVIDRTSASDVTGLRNVDGQIAQLKNKAFKFDNPVTDALAHAQLFHTPPSKPLKQDYSGVPTATLDAKDPRRDAKWLTHQRAKLPAAEDFVKLIDFHQIIAAMNQYPKLLRLLGLVVDFVLPRGTFAFNANQPLWVTCSLNSADAGVTRTQASARTRTRLSATQFDAVSRPSWQVGDYRVKDGLLVINQDLYAVLQTDVDAAALKLMNFGRTLRKLQSDTEMQADPVTKHEKDIGAPALRNAGLMLVHRRRGLLLSNAFNNNQLKNQAIENSFANNANPGPDLFAEDLIRGWRLDIWDRKTALWRSLCERHATYTVGGAITVDDDSEGVVRLAATKAADGTNKDLVYLHEALVSWNGWSLVAPQPGRLIDKDDQKADADVVVPPGINLSSVFTARPNSLPRLRYGRSYWIRARMTDLAGNSLPPNTKTFGDESPEKNARLYTRFEPVQAPSLALVREGGEPRKPAEGESMERVAIRTFNDTPDKNLIATGDAARRFAVEARNTIREAELHGMLDKGGKLDGSASMYDLLAKKDAALEEIKLVTPGPLADPANAVETSYAVMDAGATEIPYIPDPLCTTISARIFDLPGFPDATIIPIPAYTGKSWPFAAPFLIRVFEDPAQTPHFDASTRTLQIPLPKAIRATLRLSCQLEGESLGVMGVWNWLSTADRALLSTKAKSGQHWMLTPWRNVELVHAVQKPLIAPAMKFALSRGFGETRALPRFTASCSINSTARVDLQAAWHEPDADSDSTEAGADRARTDHAFSVKITDPKTYAIRKLDPKATGIPEHDIVGTDMISVGQNLHDTIARFHEFNDTRYRRVEYWLEATTRFREFMPSPILTGGEENIKVTGPNIVTLVPNSSPPPAPRVLYVVPTFGWTATTDAQGTETRWRRGGGLRVYLDRPWNASGYGEMLAVVLPPAAFNGDPNTAPAGKPYKKFVTQWGNDPIWASNFVAGVAPRLAAFPLARTAPDPSGKWLPSFAPPTEADQAPGPFQTTNLQSAGEEPVDVAPHDLAYDAERRLWYADIEINFGSSYFPFIRLALARYQPASVPGAHLSNIVLADFMPLAPDRWLSVTHGSTADVRSVAVFGWTFSDSSGSAEARSAPSSILPGNRAENPIAVSSKSVVEVWVEKLDPALGTDFGWKREAGATIVPAPPPPNPSPLSNVITAVDPRIEAHRLELTSKRQFTELSQSLKVDAIRFWPKLFDGTVTLPANRPPDGRYRLAIAEYEEYITDDATPYNRTPTTKDRRIVFLEYVDLT